MIHVPIKNAEDRAASNESERKMRTTMGELKRDAPETTPDRVVSVLLVSPCAEDHELLESLFAHTFWRLHHALSCAEARSLMGRLPVSVIVTEKSLPDGDWTHMLAAAKSCAAPPKLVGTYRFSESHSVDEMLEAGAYDTLAKPFQDNEVRQVISFAWLKWIRERETAVRPPRKSSVRIAGAAWSQIPA